MKIILTILTLMAFTGCSHEETFHNGTYQDPEELNLINDNFTETDSQSLSRSLTEKVKTCYISKQIPKAMTVALNNIKNQTEEHIQMTLITSTITQSLHDAGSFRFVNKSARTDLEDEYKFSESGAVSSASQNRRGRQAGVDYFINGFIDSVVQTDGKLKSIYYKMKLEFVNVDTGVTDCQAETQIRKTYKKTKVTE